VITVTLTETVIVVDRLLEVVIEYVTLGVTVGQKVARVRVCVILVVTDLVPEVTGETLTNPVVGRGDGLREMLGRRVISVRVWLTVTVEEVLLEILTVMDWLTDARVERLVVGFSVIRVREGVIVDVKLLVTQLVGLSVRELLVHPVGVTRAEAGTVGKLDGLKDGRKLTERVRLLEIVTEIVVV
jgi:hypothetical protein